MKPEEALAASMQYTNDTMAGAGGLKGDPGASAYEIAVANGFEGSEKEWLESLKASVQIDEEFDSSSKNPLSNDVITAEFENIANSKQDNLTFDEIPTLGSINPVTSGGVYNVVNKKDEKKEATVSNVNSEGWYRVATTPSFSSGASAIIQCTKNFNNTNSDAVTISLSTGAWATSDIVQLNKSNATTFTQCRVVRPTGSSGGAMYFDIYLKTSQNNNYSFKILSKDWVSVSEIVKVGEALETDYVSDIFTFSKKGVNASYINGIEITGLDTTPTSDSKNLITSGGVRTAIDEILNSVATANEVEHSTTKTWLDGNEIYRKDFVWKITGLTINQDNVVYLTSLMSNAVQTSMYITDANMIVQGDATISNIHCDNTGYKIKVNPTTTEIVITGFIEYVLGDYSSYTDYTTTT